ncbi:MAG TPA: hypothetical protein VL172_21355 [Kofleriaceae bacterium]|jgi:hypothetical protein|nr:hypothetical protein [Kofleriaceae bacterium]
MRTPLLGLLLVAAAAAITPACGGCGKKTVGDPSYAVFPKDSDILLGIDGTSFRQGQYRRLEQALPEAAAKAVASLRSCGIDPVDGVDKLVVAGSSQSRKIVARITGFTRDDFKQCAELARELKFTDQGGTTAFTMRGKTSHMAWLDDRTFLSGPFWKPEELADLAASKGKADHNSDLMSMVKRVDTNAPLWVAWAPPGGMIEIGMIGHVLGARGTLSMATGLEIKADIKFASYDEARSAKKLADAALPTFKEDAGDLAEFLFKIETEVDDDLVRVHINLDPQETARLISGVEHNPTVRSTLREIMPF